MRGVKIVGAAIYQCFHVSNF